MCKTFYSQDLSFILMWDEYKCYNSQDGVFAFNISGTFTLVDEIKYLGNRRDGKMSKLTILCYVQLIIVARWRAPTESMGECGWSWCQVNCCIQHHAGEKVEIKLQHLCFCPPIFFICVLAIFSLLVITYILCLIFFLPWLLGLLKTYYKVDFQGILKIKKIPPTYSFSIESGNAVPGKILPSNLIEKIDFVRKEAFH